MGKSFAGTYIPVLPRFNQSITELAIFCPAVNTKACGSLPGEESNQLFLTSMKEDGYYHIYRGILNKHWAYHLENEDDLSPMDNIAFLKTTKLFIGHGKQDTCIHYSKSQAYFDKIKQTLPQKKDVIFKLYPDGDHGPTMTNQAVKEALHWFGIKKLS